MRGALHEDYRRPDPAAPSERVFGLALTVLCAAMSVWPMAWGQRPVLSVLGLGVLVAALALAYPRVLRPLNRAWHRVMLVPRRAVGTLVLAVAYFVLVVPVALLLRLRRRLSPGRSEASDTVTFWLRRTTGTPTAADLKRPF